MLVNLLFLLSSIVASNIPFSNIVSQKVNLGFVEHRDIVPVCWAVSSRLRSNAVLQVFVVVGRSVLREIRTNTAHNSHLGEVVSSGGSVQRPDLLTKHLVRLGLSS